MRLYQIFFALFVLSFIGACGKTSTPATSTSSGYPVVSVKCGSQSCVK